MLLLIHLPLLQEISPAPKIPFAPIPASDSQLALKGIQVLLVDDADDMHFLLSRYLKQSGAEVVAVSSAAQAFEELKRIRPHILLSDIGLPEEDGYGPILIETICKLLYMEKGTEFPPPIA